MEWFNEVLMVEYFWSTEYELNRPSIKFWQKLGLREVEHCFHFGRSDVTSRDRTYIWLRKVKRIHDFGRSDVHVNLRGRKSMETRKINCQSGESPNLKGFEICEKEIKEYLDETPLTFKSKVKKSTNITNKKREFLNIISPILWRRSGCVFKRIFM